MSVLADLLAAVRAGESRVLVVRGEPGVGKTALLDDMATHATGCRVVRATGLQSEMEFAFAGLHQLLAPLLHHLERLPAPQRGALRTVFGIGAGPPPDRFLVALAVLSLLAEAAAERPLVCVVDDEQWLDEASAQALGFAGRRLAADPVGLVFGARVSGAELAGLPELTVGGLADGDARALLDSALTGPLDARVRDQIIAEAEGNPLALLELPRGMTPAELAGGFGLPGALPDRAASLTGRIEDSFRRRLGALPDQTRRLLLLAAADPSGNPSLVLRAAAATGLPVEQAAAVAAEAGLGGVRCARLGSGIRWCGRWRISRCRLRSGRRHTGRWRRRLTRWLTRTGGPGTGRRRRTGRMRRSRQTWPALRAARRPAAGWLLPRRSWSARCC